MSRISKAIKILAAFALAALLPCIAIARAPDVTGVHTARSNCSAANINDFGRIYLDNCFKGSPYMGAPTEYTLVQHGNKICGHFDSCYGFSCSRMDSGEVIGELEGNKLTLYQATGHIAEGEPQVEAFKVSSHGELLDLKTGKAVYEKQPVHLKDPSSVAQCAPDYKQPLRIVNYELDVKGSRPKTFDFTRMPRTRTLNPPPSRTVFLNASSKSLSIEDGSRESNNLIPRDVLIVNTSNRMWQAESDSNAFSACTSYLRDLEKSQKRTAQKIGFINAYDGPITVPPHSKVRTKLCSQGTLDLEPALPACPKFFCLEGCKC